jgi:DNA-binding transcriptional LysR family regulator
LENFKLFRDIVQSKSFSRAAAMNGISQSAASQHVQEVERKLGVTLLDRSTRPMTLTAAGKLYAGLCRDVLKRESQFQAALDALKSRVEGEVRVASIYSVGISEMEHLREVFQRRYPAAQLHVDYLRPDKVYEAVLAEQADLGLVSYASATKELAVIPWRKEEMSVALPPDHPLAGRKVLRPKDLDGVDFVAFDPDLAIRRELDRFLREQGVEVNVTMQFDNIQMVKEAVALGSGVSILPARTMQAEIEQGRLVAAALDAPGLFRPVSIIHLRKKAWNRAAQSFLALLQSSPSERL